MSQPSYFPTNYFRNGRGKLTPGNPSVSSSKNEFMAESERPITQKEWSRQKDFSSAISVQSSAFHSAITPNVEFKSLKLDFIEIDEIARS